MKNFELTWYQRYYRPLAAYKLLKLSKCNKYGERTPKASKLEYHHVKPLSIYGANDNLAVVVPQDVHSRLHWLLWNYYRDKGLNEEAAKMKYAWQGLDSRYGTSSKDEKWLDYCKIKDCYKYLMSHYGI